MLYSHFSLAPWNSSRWPNFTPREFACSHCGEFFYEESVFDKAQHLRQALQDPVRINSAHRCDIHNALVGGAPLSQHKRIALDVSLHGHDRDLVRQCAKEAGFTGFGFYQTFIHLDTGPRRFWFGGKVSRSAWGNMTDSEVRQWILA